VVACGGDSGALGGWPLVQPKDQGLTFGATSLSSPIVGLLFAPDGKSLVATTKNGKVACYYNWDYDGTRIRFVPVRGVKGHDGWATVVGYTADPRTFVTRGQDRLVVWWHVTDGARRGHEWQLPAGVDLWRFSPDGRFAALGLPDRRIAIVRLPAPFQEPRTDNPAAK
jgi:WD40 repeat protein